MEIQAIKDFAIRCAERINNYCDCRGKWLSMVEHTKIILKNAIAEFTEILVAVLPWSIVVSTPYLYGLGILGAVVILGLYGSLAAITYLIVIFAPLAFVVFRAIQHEDQTQYLIYVDRWEGSEEKQREALQYLISKAKKK